MLRKLFWIALVLIIAVGSTWWWTMKPARGKIDYSKREELKKVKAVENKKLEGRLLNFEYRGNWDARIKEDSEDAFGGEVMDPSMGGDRFVISFNKLKGPVEEESGIQMRRVKSEIYSEDILETNIGNGVLFKRNDSGEWVWFYQKGNYLLTIALMSPLNDDSKTDELKNLADSISFN